MLCAHKCNKKGTKYECSCKEDFKLFKDGKSCIKSEKCSLMILSVSMVGLRPLTWLACFRLISEHPCEMKDNGGCQQICVRNSTGSVCSCNTGYELNEDGKTCTKGEQYFIKSIAVCYTCRPTTTNFTLSISFLLLLLQSTHVILRVGLVANRNVWKMEQNLAVSAKRPNSSWEKIASPVWKVKS